MPFVSTTRLHLASMWTFPLFIAYSHRPSSRQQAGVRVGQALPRIAQTLTPVTPHAMR